MRVPKFANADLLRQELETKPWILTKEKAQLLNATATIMNEWQNSMNKTAK